MAFAHAKSQLSSEEHSASAPLSLQAMLSFVSFSKEEKQAVLHQHLDLSERSEDVSVNFEYLMVAVAGHLGAAVGLKTLSIHVCICPHFGM